MGNERTWFTAWVKNEGSDGQDEWEERWRDEVRTKEQEDGRQKYVKSVFVRGLSK